MKLIQLNFKKYLCLLGFIIVVSACVEEINFENEAFDYVLIIDATLTNEVKHHHIYINRAHRFEEEGPNKVTGATVQVLTGSATYTFEEEASGVYTSVEAFSAQSNVDYELRVTTKNGRVYASTKTQLTTNTQIDDLYAVRETNDDGVNGISIYVDSYDPSNTSKFYRYEFEETFRVVAPDWRNQDAYIVSDVYPECVVALEPRSEDKITCYRTDPSNSLNLTSTKSLTEDRVSKHLVRFLSSDSYQISHRYSIEATQYVQTESAYNYFEVLNEFNEEGSVFSQIQAGYIGGNISSETNPSEKIVGFFEVSAVSKKRIFFNYTDFYQGEPLPPYAVPCERAAPDLFGIPHSYECGPIMNIIKNNAMVYLKDNKGEFPIGGPYIMVPRACGDCTAIGETIIPDFWTE